VEALTAQLHKDASAVEALFKASASHPST
jgi:hypothetical protein